MFFLSRPRNSLEQSASLKTNILNFSQLFKSDSILKPFSNLATFKSLVAEAVKMTASKCCQYTNGNRKLFATYAIPALTTNQVMTYGNLLSLGPCFTSALPVNYLKTMSPSDFLSYFTNLGMALQPDSEETANIVEKLTSLKSEQKSQEDFVFSTLKDLAIFYPSFASLNSVLTKFDPPISS